MGNLERIKNKIKENKTIIGTSVTFSDSCITELLSYIGFDYIWIDMEHSCNSKREVLLHIMATKGTNAASFVRIPWNDPVLVKPILEMGPDGIIFPFIRNAKDAKKAVQSCYYPPKGIRGFGPIRGAKYGLIARKIYINEIAPSIWKIMQIESADAVKNLDGILNVEGVDAIMIGINDLSGSIGYLENPEHMEVKKLEDVICQKVLNAGIPLGVAMMYDPEKVKEWIARGANIIEIGGDFVYLKNAAKEAFKFTQDIASKGVRK